MSLPPEARLMPTLSGPPAAAELRRRMTLPQRHRLLHGYPLAAALHPADAVSPDHALAFNRTDRQLIVGVLPHPFCNPAVTGCGFCVFPHEPGNAAKTTSVVESVMSEIRQAANGQMDDLWGAKVAALYFGGGTANLTEPEPFRHLCIILNAEFDLTQAEVTLEGVPAYFLRGSRWLFSSAPRLMKIMKGIVHARHFRISMGIQTFDEARLKQMGRAAFGNADTFRQVVDYAHSLGFSASADFLFNLPGQTLDQMKDDVRRAADLGLDHLGLYHLVLFRGLGTPWAEDDDLLAELPDNERACDHWLALRELLLELGFYQTSLTNFERVRFRDKPDRYRYEECSFRPHEYEAIGFGPSGTSYVATPDFAHGVKVMNPTSSAEYTAAVATGKRVWNKVFVYRPHDQKVLWLTRRLAALDIDRKAYRRLFGTDAERDFPDEFAALQEADLVEVTPGAIRPTPRGMFYADSIAALWAGRAIRTNRPLGPAVIGRDAPGTLLHNTLENNSGRSSMG
jgi:oxygen-independent coproporphyrinogen-3 oxidase